MTHLVDKAEDAAVADETIDLGALIEKVIAKSKREDAELVAFDLGSGKNPAGRDLGVHSVDMHCEADVSADLFASPWTFVEDGAVDFFFSSHFVEHVPDWGAFWLEVWKKLRVGGYALVIHPYGTSNRAWQDPTHRQIITEERYWYLNRDARVAMGVEHYSTPVNFVIETLFPLWNEDFAHLENEDAKRYHMKHTINAVDDLMVLLQKAE